MLMSLSSIGQLDFVQAQEREANTILPFLAPGTQYLWPTSASDYLSATFGETRAAHYHAAVDIGTWGQRGYRVYATRDGILSRVSVTPTGYGNAVYLKHDDGSYSIYAHLQDFIPKIREVVDSIRFKSYRFIFDQNLEHLNMQIKKGDLIAFSGDTGIGPPHLHFELRTPSNNPFNPLLVGISVPDNVPPRFASLSIEPLSEDAMVNGRKQITRVPIRGGGRSFEFNDVRIEGEVGLGVDASDRADAMRNVYAVYELKLSINDSLYFHSRADSFEIGNSRMMLLDRVYPILRAERRGYQRLYIRDGNRTTFYKDVGHDGKINLEPGRYRVRIEASDFFGNTSIARGAIIVSEPEYIKPHQQTKTAALDSIGLGNSGLPTAFNDLFWTSKWVGNSGTRREYEVRTNPTGSYVNQGQHQATLSGNKAISLQSTAPQIVTIDNEQMTIHRAIPGQRTIFRTKDQRLQLEFRANSLYDTLSVSFAYKYDDDEVLIQTGPDHEPLRSSYTMRFLLDADEVRNPNLGIYSISWNGRNPNYSFVGGARSGNYIQASTTGFGNFTILSDTVKPQISRPRVYRRNDGKWFASVRVSDNLSGVDHTSAIFHVNNVRGIAEFDPFSNQIIYHLPGFSPRRVNEFRVKISDRAGNTTEEVFTVNR